VARELHDFAIRQAELDPFGDHVVTAPMSGNLATLSGAISEARGNIELAERVLFDGTGL
jgi:hypothetical protein